MVPLPVYNAFHISHSRVHINPILTVCPGQRDRVGGNQGDHTAEKIAQMTTNYFPPNIPTLII